MSTTTKQNHVIIHTDDSGETYGQGAHEISISGGGFRTIKPDSRARIHLAQTLLIDGAPRGVPSTAGAITPTVAEVLAALSVQAGVEVTWDHFAGALCDLVIAARTPAPEAVE